MNKYKKQSRWKESRGCVAKRRFDTYYEALLHIGERRRVYKCDFCPGWHSTTSYSLPATLTQKPPTGGTPSPSLAN